MGAQRSWHEFWETFLPTCSPVAAAELDVIEANAAAAIDARPSFRKHFYLVEYDAPMPGEFSETRLVSVPDFRSGCDIVLASRVNLDEVSCMLRGARDIRAHWLETEGWQESETSLDIGEEVRALSALVSHRREQQFEGGWQLDHAEGP